MNNKFGTILKIEGALLMVLAGCMVPSLLIAAAQGESSSIMGFGSVIAICVITGFILYHRFKSQSRQSLRSRDGFLVVAASWFIVWQDAFLLSFPAACQIFLMHFLKQPPVLRQQAQQY